jgi:hypothetical protein
MIPITDNDSAALAKYELDLAFLDKAAWQLRNGECVLAEWPGELREACEFSVEWGKLIFAWWDEQSVQNWRVQSYEITPAEIRLRATRSFGRDLTTLVLRNIARWRDRPLINSEQRRQCYSNLLGSLLSQHFANARLHKLADMQGYSRWRMQIGQQTVLVIGLDTDARQEEIDGIVAAGLVWLAAPKAGAQRLCFCVPSERSQTVIERLTLFERQPYGAQLECFEVDERAEKLTAVTLAVQAELLHHQSRELHWPTTSAQTNPWRAQILALAPDLIEVRANSQLECESFSVYGLEFARARLHGLKRVSFGIAGLPEDFAAPAQANLGAENFSQLSALVHQLIHYRRAQSSDRHHPFYRLRAEAWLESLLRRDIRALDASLDDRFVYSQIPAWRAEDRSVLDLLTVNHLGRLVVIEIKAAEDAQLPLQGLDYWLRVEQARLRGEFAQRGLFSGIELADAPPLLYLVAPRLRFHRSFITIAQCIAPEIEVYRLGINTNWRSGVRVHERERVNGRNKHLTEGIS